MRPQGDQNIAPGLPPAARRAHHTACPPRSGGPRPGITLDPWQVARDLRPRSSAGNPGRSCFVVTGMTTGSAVNEGPVAVLGSEEESSDGSDCGSRSGTGGVPSVRGPRWRWWAAALLLAIGGLVASQVVGEAGHRGGTPGKAASSARSSAATVAGAAGLSTGSGNGSPVVASSGSSSAPSPQAAAATGGMGAAAPAPGVLPNEVPALPTKVIKSGSVSIQVPPGKLEDVVSNVTLQSAAAGGFIAGTSERAPEGSNPPSASLTVKLPVARFETFVAYVQHQGTVLALSTTGQDVTASYVDLQARITALQDTRTQFEQILARATTIGDILSVESQIGDLETQIEQLQGQFNVLDNETSYSTLTVDVTETPKPGVVVHPERPPSGLDRAWLHARHSFSHGIEAVLGATGGIAVFLLLAGMALAVGRLAWTSYRRRTAS